MSQVIRLTPSSGPGSGTVTSVAASGGLTSVPNPIIAAGTILIDQTNLTVQDGTVYWDTGTQRLNTTATGTVGQFLRSGGAGVAPAYATLPADVTSITGNSGAAQTGAINLITANATPTFVGAAGTITLDFNKSNLILGNNGSTITVGAANDGFGSGVFQNLISGSSNSAFGNASLQNLTTGSQNSTYGASSGTALNTGGNSTLIGYQSGLLLQSGNSNVALGYQSGATWGAAVSNNIAIGNVGSVADSGRIRIGTNGTQTSAFITGIDTVNVGSVAKVVTMASDQLGTATITAGAGILITPSANTITISTAGGGITWTVITANQTAVIENGYFCNKAGTLALLLPAASAVGDTFEVVNINTATGTQITQGAGQQIFFSTASTTLGAAGTLTSSALGDTLRLVCRTANLTWYVVSSIGNWTPA